MATWARLFLSSEILCQHTVDVINTTVIGNRVQHLLSRNVFDEIVRTLRIIQQTYRKVNTSAYDIVHINTPCSPPGMMRDWLCALTARRAGVRLVLHCHSDTRYRVRGKLATLIFKQLCNTAQLIFCLDAGSHQHIKSITAVPCMQMPNFIPLDTSTPHLAKPGAEKISTVVYVGRVTKLKGCDDIITVACQRPDLTFRLIGYLSEEIRCLPAPPNVLFLGELEKEQVQVELQQADLLLFPSRTEGFPTVVMEAMLHGLPVIATPVGAIPEMLEAEGGILVEIGNVAQMLAALRSMENKDLRERMSRWNVAKVQENYSADTVVARILEQYKAIG